MHGVYIRDQGVFTNKKLSNGNTRVNGRGIRKDGICGYSFIFTWDIESWESRFEMFSHGESSRCHSPLIGVLESFIDSFSIDPTKIRFSLVVVYGCGLLITLLDRSGGCIRKDGYSMDDSTMDVTTFIYPGIVLVPSRMIRCSEGVSMGIGM